MEAANAPFVHNPKIAELTAELEKFDAERLVFLADLKARSRLVRAERDGLMMREQLTLRVLNGSPVSAGEQKWIDANPEAWAEIKEATKGKRGSRRSQPVKAGG